MLRTRAAAAARVRQFFARRGVLEVETPLLAAAGTPEVHLDSVACGVGGRTLYLQTSPEFHMKRLLAAGSGPLYQLFRAVRGGEAGRRHNLEFTLLEWYRPGFDHHALMDEVEELLAAVLGTERLRPGARVTYGELFRRHLGLDPHAADVAELDRAVAAAALAGAGDPGPIFAPDDRDGRLHLLMALAVEPRLPRGLVFVYDYPASQASLARVRPGAGGAPAVAERFEAYVDGVELANGFHELTDAGEQRRRFAADLAHRRAHGLPEVPLDERLLAALAAGLPPSAGVALGFDRLVMLATGAASIAEVLAFPTDRA
ncbi:MAG TPA: EF-P lysine aminoacylase EpmA [Thermoanaerobaculia bacterium]|nr:EF-P lysine aminoacylase EpmA [Thermoanaerobaculia bacterium]